MKERMKDWLTNTERKERWLCAAAVRDNGEGGACLRLHSSLLFLKELEAAAPVNTQCIAWSANGRYSLLKLHHIHDTFPGHTNKQGAVESPNFVGLKTAVTDLRCLYCLRWFHHYQKLTWRINMQHCTANTVTPDHLCRVWLTGQRWRWQQVLLTG